MKGRPKYKVNETVRFTINEVERTGVVFIVDAYGAFECNDVSYDILVDQENCLYKHVEEKYVTTSVKA